MNRQHILVVDDEEAIRALLREILEDEGYTVTVAGNVAAAQEARRARRPDLILLDIWMPDGDGITLLKEWAQGYGMDVPVIMISGHGNVETAVEATRIGAFDFLEKPLSHGKLLVTIERALEMAALKRENIGLRRQTSSGTDVLGTSRAITQLKEQMQRIAQHNTTVFLTGESGCGKEVFARFLHLHSPRARNPFLVVNIGGVAKDSLEHELFGSETNGKVHFGALEQANGGTVLLKDVADLGMDMQARLLNALETQSILRVDGREPVRIDVRVVAATRHDLREEVAVGRFRDDLYYHLNVVPLRVPALRQHAEDVPELLERYLESFVTQEGLPRRQFSGAALQRLRAYNWPGNVRELKNMVQRLLILGSGSVIEAPEVEQALGLRAAPVTDVKPGFDLPMREAREQFEKSYLEYQLQIEQGNVSKVAEKIGLERTHLHRKLRALGIDSKFIKQASTRGHDD
ncbi:MAG: sigma-54 dependent transcriptional regulator [Gammaproteobacteria bacterium]